MLFFNYAFPLIFFFLMSAMLHAERGGSVISVIVTNVLVIGILGNGFFGAGIRAVQKREQNILRRFKVAPISPLPILGASLTTGLLLFIPAILLTLSLARALYGMPLPDRPISLVIFLAIGALAFRSVGLIVAAVSNSTAESTVLVQLLYMPMMFLSGAAIPASLLPRWTQTIAQFLPASYLVSGMQGITFIVSVGVNLVIVPCTPMHNARTKKPGANGAVVERLPCGSTSHEQQYACNSCDSGWGRHILQNVAVYLSSDWH